MRTKQSAGFTIVELLNVIVVIAILAAMTVVTYNGIQARATFSSYQTVMAQLNNAVKMYYVDNGRYPVPASATVDNCSSNISTGIGNNLAMPGITPTYISKIPDSPSWNGGANFMAYCYRVDGSGYKLIRLVPSGQLLPSVESSFGGGAAADPYRPGRAWGYWTAGETNL